jgi:alpha-L-fucosidase
MKKFYLRPFLIAHLVILGMASNQAHAIEQPLRLPIANGPFKGTEQSLATYQCPEWFRDAKFGIWAHWGPQAVPMRGDWYARGMYAEDNFCYKDHIEHYGHPSKFGYKDIIPLWKAEKWDPERLMELYKKAGAKYFVSMGIHHDNFCLWNSKIHRWNSVNMGPKMDVVALWEKAAHKAGLRFGVSEHLAASFNWFQLSHGSDKSGPFTCIPYDGADRAFEDLYHFPSEPGDTGWITTDRRRMQIWYDRINELVTNYNLDLLYSDSGVPFGNEVGYSMIANLYNTAIKNHGSADAVYTCKSDSQGQWIHDFERNVQHRIAPYPWQTDSSIGDWFYNVGYGYQPASWAIHKLVDVVSKNGNLLLNVVQRPDGSIDPEVEKLLGELAAWTAVNGEAIYGSRPWQVYGEGEIHYRAGFSDQADPYSAKDIRFTTKGPVLYAIALGWPDGGQLQIRTLARTSDCRNAIQRIQLLGSPGDLQFTQNADALIVTLPKQKISDHTCTLKITGSDLKAVPGQLFHTPVKSDENGCLTLGADNADLHGDGLNIETQNATSNVIRDWGNGKAWVSWKVPFPKVGRYAVSISLATSNAGTSFIIEMGKQALAGKTTNTDFKDLDLGFVTIDKPGEQIVSMRAENPAKWRALSLLSVTMTPEK